MINRFNKVVKTGFILIPVFAVYLVLVSWVSVDEVSKPFRKKINKQLEQLWGKELQLENTEYSETVKLLLHKNGAESVFVVKDANQSVGYVVLAKARSKFEDFDFVIYYDQNKVIKAVRVLQYREDYGGEIASKRWLKQFDGKTAQSPIKIDDDIQGISGATISYLAITSSVRSLTQIMNEI